MTAPPGGTLATRQRRWVLVAVVVAVAAAGGGLILRARRSGSSAALAGKARQAGTAFLTRYVDPDGRVVRRDQGGDTVSEGQAYALLIAVGVGDHQHFATVWQWTQSHLQRPDGLLSSTWSGGRVQDPQPAADADLDAARALLLAADRFGVPSYRTQALRMAAAILREETHPQAGGALLVAGPWAQAAPQYVNPSYLAPATFEALASATGDAAWGGMASASRSALRTLLTNGSSARLPPDWAQIQGAGLQASAAPGGGTGPQYGFDAVRTFVRLAEDCDPAGRSLAAASWPFFRGLPGHSVAAVYHLDGTPAVQYSHPAALVAAAATAQAAGDHAAAANLLDQADALQGQQASYYGGAWTALGRILLTTPWLHAGGCG